jgi:hypothetical protein
MTKTAISLFSMKILKINKSSTSLVTIPSQWMVPVHLYMVFNNTK